MFPISARVCVSGRNTQTSQKYFSISDLSEYFNHVGVAFLWLVLRSRTSAVWVSAVYAFAACVNVIMGTGRFCPARLAELGL